MLNIIYRKHLKNSRNELTEALRGSGIDPKTKSSRMLLAERDLGNALKLLEEARQFTEDAILLLDSAKTEYLQIALQMGHEWE